MPIQKARRVDLSEVSGPAALEATFGRVDETSQMLLIASRSDQPTAFGAVIQRDDTAFYFGIAHEIEESITGIDTDGLANRLFIMMGGGVERHDEGIVIGLILGVAQQFWREDNLTPEQIIGAHVVLSPTETTCDLYAMSVH